MENEEIPQSPEFNNPENVDATVTTEYEPAAVVVKPFHFILLSIATFGLYNVWWLFKCFRYFKEKEQWDIYPALRAIFFIFFGYELFQKILAYAQSKEYPSNYNPGWVFLIFIAINFTSRLPDPYWVVCLLAFVPLLYPLKAFNYYFTGSENGTGDSKLGTAEIWLLVIGALLWVLVVAGLAMDDTSTASSFAN